jgi:hypothetical protein
LVGEPAEHFGDAMEGSCGGLLGVKGGGEGSS